VTLIRAGNSNGVYGRCDARCHDAEKPKCDCICGGLYHGKKSGSPELYQAIKESAEALAKKLEGEGADVRPLREILTGNFPARQEPMFWEGP
jgi:hypothetical protein